MVFDLNTVRDILNGRYNRIPDLRKKFVRIFLSSTFTDTNAERNYLIEKVYPQLKEYCKQNYDLDFQSVDMRWGIPSDAYEYHGTTELCLNEIKNCKKFSIGPSFVTLIGQKYGLRPLPRRIDAKEYETLRDQVLADASISTSLSYTYTLDDATRPQTVITYHLDNLMNECYKLDTNSVPYKYRLLQISKIIPDYLCDEPKRQECAQKFWDMIENRLSQLLRLGAQMAFSKNLIDKTKKDRYFVSITEKEIFEGMFKEKNPNQTSLCFIRTIENLEENLTDANAPRFIDTKLDPNTSMTVVETEAKSFLDDLKNNKIPSILSSDNILKFNVLWKNNGIEKQSLEEYLENFGRVFTQKIIRMIDDAISFEKKQDTTIRDIYSRLGLIKENDFNHNIDSNMMIQEFKEFIAELGSHANEYNNTISKFFGRDDIMTRIKDYILSKNNNIPFVVTGESGCGKTNIMAIAHQMIPTWLENSDNYLIITRFLGTTAQTSSIFKTYRSIALQLHYVINFLTQKSDMDNYKNLNKCHDLSSIKEFILSELEKIGTIDPNKRIIFILDSLDQLTPDDYKNIDKWLFTHLPANTKYIVSTIPDHGNLLDMICKLIRKKFNEQLKAKVNDEQLNDDIYAKRLDNLFQNQIFHVRQLTPVECENILGNWLVAAEHWLTEKQWDHLRYIFNNGVLLPLFLKLIFDLALKWRSYDECDPQLLECLKIDQMIVYLFKSLERMHGSVIFRRAISYMTVCRNGISDNEIEDILSIDDDVLYSVFQYHLPPVRRLPSILWIRIKNDLEEYIVEKEANDTKVVYWYHRRFVEVTLNKYLKTQNKAENEAIFQNIFDFYNETWKNKEKPFELNEYLKEKLKKTSNKDTTNLADRHVSSQPIKYVGEDGLVRYNKRKLNELPNCLRSINTVFGLKKACDLIFFNYEFLHAKFKCESIDEVMDDLNEIMRNQSSWDYKDEVKTIVYQLKLFEKCLSLCGNYINDYPDSLAFHLTSRLMNYYGSLDEVTKLIDECDRLSRNECALLTPYLQNEPPGGYLISNTNKHHEPIIKFVFAGSFFFTYSRSKVCVYKLNNILTQSFLFDVHVPNRHQLKEFVDYFQKFKSSRGNVSKPNAAPLAYEPKYEFSFSTKFKCIFDFEFNHYRNANNVDTNPDLFPVRFLVIEKQYTFIVSTNRQLKFFYESSTEILDVFVLANKRLVVVEKNTQHLKIFPEYELNPTKWNEFTVSDLARVLKCETTNNSTVIDENVTHLDLLLLLDNGELRQYLFKYEKVFSNSHSDFYLDNDSSCSDADDADAGATNDMAKHKQSIKLDDFLSVEYAAKIRSTGIDNFNVFKVKLELTSILTHYISNIFGIGKNYISLPNGDFLMLNYANKFSCHFYAGLTRQPIVYLRKATGLEGSAASMRSFLGLAYTNDFVYFIHSHKKSKYDLCRLELREKPDWFEVVSKNKFVICRLGQIKLYKCKCLRDSHRLKLILSIYSTGQRVTFLTLIDHFLFVATGDGDLSMYNLLRGKRNEKFLPTFDRALNTINKFYAFGFNALTCSKQSELLMWSLKDGKTKEKIHISEKPYNFSGNIVSLKLVDEKGKKFLLVTNQGELGLFQASKLLKKALLSPVSSSINSNNRKNNSLSTQKLVILPSLHTSFDQTLNFQCDKKLTIFDMKNLIYYEFDVDSFRVLNRASTLADAKSLLGKHDKIALFDVRRDADQTECKSVLLIDKHLRTFAVHQLVADTQVQSRHQKYVSDDAKEHPLHYVDYRDEKLVKKFFQNYGLAKRYKYKIGLLGEGKYLLSINAFILNDFEDYESFSNLIVIFALKKIGAQHELDIQKVYPFCKAYFASRWKSNFILTYNYAFELNAQLAVDKREYMIDFSCYERGRSNEIKIVNLSNGNRIVFELNLALESMNWCSVRNIAIDTNMAYLVFTDAESLVWLYRIGDSQRLACLPMQSQIRGLKFVLDNKYICMNMNDRRLFLMMLIDPHEKKHQSRLSELESRNRSDSDEARRKQIESENMRLEDDAKKTNDHESNELDSTDYESKSDDDERYKLEKNRKKIVRQTTLKSPSKKSLSHDSSSDSEKETELKERQNIVYFPKHVCKAQKLKLKPSDLDKPNWLKNYLDNEHKTSTERATFYPDSDSKQNDSEIFEKDKVSFRNELKSSIKVNEKSPKLINFGHSPIVVNSSSSKACILS